MYKYIAEHKDTWEPCIGTEIIMFTFDFAVSILKRCFIELVGQASYLLKRITGGLSTALYCSTIFGASFWY